MTIKIAAVAALVCILAVGSAHAATTHVFDLTKSGDAAVESTDNSFTLESDTLTESGEVLSVTFTAGYAEDLSVEDDGTISDGSFSEAEEIERHNNGAGVCRDVECTESYDAEGEPHTVDGVEDGTHDYIEMAFYVDDTLVDVTLTELTFGWIGEWTWNGEELGVEGTNGSFEIIADTNDDGSDAGIGVGDTVVYSAQQDLGFYAEATNWMMGIGGEVAEPNIDVRQSRGSVDLTDEELVDSVFGIKAGDDGSWKLLGVTVEYDETTSPTPTSGTPTPPPPPIPLPAGFWLMLSGLGGLGWLRRQSRLT